MFNTKVNLTIELLGGTMFSEQECSKQLTDNLGETYEVADTSKLTQHSMLFKEHDTGRTEVLHYSTRKSHSAYSSLNISDYAYNFMTDVAEVPDWESKNRWITMTKEERLLSHLERIAHDAQGVIHSYSIFE